MIIDQQVVLESRGHRSCRNELYEGFSLAQRQTGLLIIRQC